MADEEEVTQVHVILGVPFDTKKFSLPVYVPGINSKILSCDDCGERLWIGPKQLEMREKNNYKIMCPACVGQISLQEDTEIVVKPPLNPESNAGFVKDLQSKDEPLIRLACLQIEDLDGFIPVAKEMRFNAKDNIISQEDLDIGERNGALMNVGVDSPKVNNCTRFFIYNSIPLQITFSYVKSVHDENELILQISISDIMKNPIDRKIAKSIVAIFLADEISNNPERIIICKSTPKHVYLVAYLAERSDFS